MFKHKIENTYRHISKKRAVLDLHSVAARRAVIYILIHHNVPQSDRGTPKRTRPSGSKARVPHALHYEAKPRGPDARSRVRVKSGAQTGAWEAPLCGLGPLLLEASTADARPRVYGVPSPLASEPCVSQKLRATALMPVTPVRHHSGFMNK